jgi:acyl-CoA dehydrogenase
MKALHNDDLSAFDHNFWAHVGHLVRNKFRFVLLYLTRGYLHIPTQKGVIGKYERKLAWASAEFAYVADLALAIYGGGIKMKERVNSRFGDILSNMFLATCALRRFEAEGETKEDKIAMEYAVQYCLAEIQKAFVELYDNMPAPFKILSFMTRINPFGGVPSDRLAHKIAEKLMEKGGLRDNLTTEVYLPKTDDEHLGRLEKAFNLALEGEDLLAKIKQAMKEKKLPKGKPENMIAEALEANIITELEAASLKKAREVWLDAVQVDSFELDDYSSYQMEKSII